ACLVVVFRWTVPSYRGAPYPPPGRSARFGASVGEIVAGALLPPLHTLGGVLTGQRLIYLLALLAPLGFLPLLGLPDLVGAGPGLAQNLLADDPILFNHRSQYQAFVLPFLITAAIAGYRRVARHSQRWAVAMIAVAVVASLALGSRTVNNFAVARWWRAASTRAAYSVLARVPPTAAVSAQDPYVPHLSLRPLVFVFPVGLDRSDYVLLNVASYPWRNLPDVTMAREAATVTIEMEDGHQYRYEVVAEAGSHLLLRRA